jgi:hypothetical protein
LGRPNVWPRAFAAAIPLRTRSPNKSCSNSASEAIREATSLPCGVDRSKVRPLCAMRLQSHEASSPRVFIKSCVERPHRVSSVTSTTSISRRCASAITRARSTGCLPRLLRIPDRVSL